MEQRQDAEELVLPRQAGVLDGRLHGGQLLERVLAPVVDDRDLLGLLAGVGEQRFEEHGCRPREVRCQWSVVSGPSFRLPAPAAAERGQWAYPGCTRPAGV